MPPPTLSLGIKGGGELWPLKRTYRSLFAALTSEIVRNHTAKANYPGKRVRCGLFRLLNGTAFSVCVRTPEFRKSEGRTADPSTTLRFGRDDKAEGISSICIGRIGWTKDEPSGPIANFAPSNWPPPLSSRPERSAVEGSAVRPSDFRNSGVLNAEVSPQGPSTY